MNYSVFRHQSYFAFNYIDRGHVIWTQIKHLQSPTLSFFSVLHMGFRDELHYTQSVSPIFPKMAGDAPCQRLLL